MPTRSPWSPRPAPGPVRLVAVALLLGALAGGAAASRSDGYGHARRQYMRNKVVEMFYHAYDNYMAYAFPHDELKPLTKSFTDSLSELGNLNLQHLPHDYNGSALTLVESLSSLVVLGNFTEFERGISWLSENLIFDVDARVNLFECNIRLLGGLISAHILAKDYNSQLKGGVYQDQLLHLAENLGSRFLPAFETPTGLPYAWINLKHGVMENETTETSTSGCGVDSFYEYLIKAYILFGSDEYWDMFHSAYLAVQKYFRHGPWYHEADIRTGEATHWQLTSLQAFWPGVQTLLGDVAAANLSHREFYNVWQRFGVLPERYLLDYGILHPTEKYYPLRPEFAESTFYLYQATKDPWYLEVGEAIVGSLNYYTKVEGGFASIRDVSTMKLEDHQHSFFLSETCKYLFLLYDDSFLRNKNYIFTTEGHPLPVRSTWHEKFPRSDIPTNWTFVKNDNQPIRASALSSKVCPETIFRQNAGSPWESACHVPDVFPTHRCRADDDCGIESVTCKRRTCSMAGYCGLWLAVY
ncbi:alpha-mannosidase I MNS5 isoform X2 [Lolium rigidum]|uniref:alpha-mannosidase I MNS5 isoform X2 n=1 Tax=Lolium rigidum TaxID=89674 RepID=UPI001F5D843C|nr:alpha-mannosidase I MNS5 isoform X2 [Lolium rigidum]